MHKGGHLGERRQHHEVHSKFTVVQYGVAVDTRLHGLLSGALVSCFSPTVSES